ncbi:beta-lactamase-like protein [Cantharellus anzutake]|uniref:beta-lactamase-like protein n=1 Tax=Cantharellus anzutake TaxID=1750568 RepID=UPI001904AEF4|nr:beta-lactamase-like protein [Cantharellus anzutake]KAF8332644.1 beta-lactamase-like protein [Cantharellus anzutake]
MMAGTVPVDSLQINILVDNSIEWMTALPPPFLNEVPQQLRNNPPIDEKLTGLPFIDLENYCCGAHGLSFLITTTHGDQRHTILFDAGPESKSIDRNIKALKIDPKAIERIVLSHWHADHSGGILTALQLIREAQEGVSNPLPVDLHPKRPIARGIAPAPSFKPIARLPADPTLEEIKEAGGEPVLNAEGHAICDGQVWVSGEIQRVTDFETGLVGGIEWVDGSWQREPGQLVMDERYAVVDVRGKGLVIFSSCSHAGIVNVLHSASKTFPGRPIHMILGGLHLAGPELAYRIEPTVEAIASYKPDYVVPLHCTGFDAKVKLREALGDKIVPGGVGTGVFIVAVKDDESEENRNTRSG